MKILHLLNALSEGGVESLVFDLCSYSVGLGHEVAVWVLERDAVALKKKFERIGVKILTGKFPRRYDLRNIWQIRQYMKSYSLVHVHHFPGQVYAVLAVLSLPPRQRPQLVITEHSTFNNRRNYPMLRIVDRFCYRHYMRIICVGDSVRRNLIAWLGPGFPTEKIETIANGINIAGFSHASNALGKYVVVDSGIAYIVMVGRFDVSKDQLTLIRALAYCPEHVHLILVGSGTGLSLCKAKALEWNLFSRIHFLGYCEHVAGVLKGCKIGVISSFWEGFGLVALEYMAAGLPVLASDVEGLRQVVGNPASLFQVGNAEELATKLNRLLNNGDEYEKAKQYSLNRVLLYTAEAMSQKYMALYSTLERESL